MNDLQLVTRDGRSVPLRGTKITIGRGADNDLVLNITELSRHHAEIRFDGQTWALVDLGSTNGTAVDGGPLRPHQAMPLRPGSTVSMGGHDVFHLEYAPVASIPFPIDVDEFEGPARKGRTPWVYALAALAAILIIGLGVLVVLLLNETDDAATPTSQQVGETAAPVSTPGATGAATPVGEGEAPTATWTAAPPSPTSGGEAIPTSPSSQQAPSATPPINATSLVPTLSDLATMMPPVLTAGTPGAQP
ncbi:MAG: FHA domain-containing protein [Anaerolineae bacterium]|nr:FHA domain-containing protein [Anaerolineae bacterium]